MLGASQKRKRFRKDRNSGPLVYAVAVGREGPKIYQTRAEYVENVEGYPRGMGKSFRCLEKARNWLNLFKSETKDGGSGRSPPSGDMDTSEDVAPAENIPELLAHSPQAAIETLLSNQSAMPQDFDDEPPLYTPMEGVHPLGVAADDYGVPDIVPEYADPKPLLKDYVQLFGEGLSVEQKEILKVVDKGESIFFTGAAGTGKSFTLRAVINMMRAKYSSRHGAVAVTASTGIAALNIGGQTLHSFTGLGLGKKPVKELLWELCKNETTKKRWRILKTLILDEISMVDGTFFDKLEEIARTIRKSNLPFGGIQLPPVPDQYQGKSVPVCFAFDALSWCHCIKLHIRLTRVFRQKDSAFINILNDMRLGKAGPTLTAVMRELERDIDYDGIEPVQLYPLKRAVESANGSRLDALPGETFYGTAVDNGRWEPWENPNDTHEHQERIKYLLNKYSPAPREIMLKEGAQVMLIRNLVPGELVNGSLGRVVDFATAHEARTRGILSCVEILKQDLEAQLEKHPNQSSQHQLQRLEDVTANIKVPDIAWPIVEFENKRKVAFMPIPFDMEDAFGDLEATRVQVPLILAWAITVHKSQGQTIQRLKVDFGGTFEYGQAYVAMSRSIGMDTLQVLNFTSMIVRAHPRVLAWYETVIWKDERDSEEAVRAYFLHQS